MGVVRGRDAAPSRAQRPGTLRAQAHENLEPRVLDIDEIKPYEFNPRRAEHGEYARIKASICAGGLEQPLVVTMRPGESGYRLHGGGNTRLKILRELYCETGDARFGKIACWYRAWTDEADVMLAHLKENDLRGDLIFVDKALAVADAERWLATDKGEKLTQTELADALARRGYALSQGLISQMKYAVERLFAVMPRALEAGLGRRQVMRIRSLDRVARALWMQRTLDTEAEYDEAFGVLCRRYDDAEWDPAPLRRALEAEIAERADLSIHAVSLDIDAGLAGRPFEATAAPGEGEAERRANGQSFLQTVAAGAHEPLELQASGTPKRWPVKNSSDAIADCTAPSAGGQERGETTAGRVRAPAVTPSRGQEDIESLRETLWALASGLAERNGLGGLVRRLVGKGTGLVVCDVPDAAVAGRLDSEDLARVSLMWWHLAACAETTVAPPESLLSELPEQSRLRAVLRGADTGKFLDRVWTLDPGQAGFGLWRAVSERDWRDMLALMGAYRAMHRHAAAEGIELWDPP